LIAALVALNKQSPFAAAKVVPGFSATCNKKGMIRIAAKGAGCIIFILIDTVFLLHFLNQQPSRVKYARFQFCSWNDKSDIQI
jgi:hypothetical protein